MNVYRYDATEAPPSECTTSFSECHRKVKRTQRKTQRTWMELIKQCHDQYHTVGCQAANYAVCNDVYTDIQVSYNELSFAIDYLDINKSCGIDGIYAQHLL